MDIFYVYNLHAKLNTFASMVVIAKDKPEYVCPYGPTWVWDEDGKNWYTVERIDGELKYIYFPLNLWSLPENLQVRKLGVAGKDVPAEVVELASYFE